MGVAVYWRRWEISWRVFISSILLCVTTFSGESFRRTNRYRFLPVIVLSFLVIPISEGFTSSHGMESMSPRVVLTKQAQFQGFLGPGNIRRNSVYQSDPYSFRSYGHPVVEIFKGIPYGNPPLETLRYESPSPYPFNSSEVYTANVIKTPCPRFGNETRDTSSYRPRDSIRGLKKTLNMEDCLYLDIYAPMTSNKDSGTGLPVLVYANSQADDEEDPLDGSSMAIIGNLIFISFRYRVGVLGFLHPGYSEEVRSNFGLWDQLAALQWIRENIKVFGGDENNVCLMGSDLDASLVGVLAFSRMSQAYGGLFHRLILLNGSPFSPTSLHLRPMITTVKLARALGCPLHERDGELIACLRRKPVTQLLSAAQTIGVEDLESPFMPGLDGTIVQHDLGLLSFGSGVPNSIQEILSRFDLLCGLGKGPILPNSGRTMWQNIELDRFVTAAIKLVLKLEPGAKPTGNLKQDVIRAIQQQYDDTPLMRELISDFLVVNPMIQLLDAHAESGKNTFFYVSNDYDPLHKGKHNELSYILTNKIYQWKYVDLGQPNLDLQPFELFISFIANFVRTGDPNLPNPNPGDRVSQGKWLKYKKSQGRYLSFGRDVAIHSKYRRPQTDFWSQIFPAILKPFIKHLSESDNYPNELNNWNTNNNIPPFFGGGGGGLNRGQRFPNLTHIYPTSNFPHDPNQVTSSMTQSSVILIGCLLLLLNVLCFMGLFYQRERLKKAERQLRKRFLENEEQAEEQRRSTSAAAAGVTTNNTAAEVDSQVSDPYLARTPPSQFHSLTHPQDRDIYHVPMPMPIPLDAMSETETDNGFGPDFLGPNYDPRTKVSRWMFHQNQNPENNYERPMTPNPMSHYVPPSVPMHIDIRSLQRRPEGSSNLLTTAPTSTATPQYGPFLPDVYHTHPHPHAPAHAPAHGPYGPPFHPNFGGSDIPYADSRATSPSVSNFAENYPQHRVPPMNNNLSNVNFNNNQRRTDFPPQPSPMDEFPKRTTPAVPNRSSIMIPVRNSIVIRELDPDDSVESSAPKLVPLKTGTLTRSVGVGSNHVGPPSSIQSQNNNGTDGGSEIVDTSMSTSIVPTSSIVALPSASSRHPPHGTVQKVTFADGL